jgi:hypothetical protein
MTYSPVLLPGIALALVLGTAAFTAGLLQPAAETVTLPIEVMGPDGASETVQVNVSDASSVDHLWVKAYSIGYPYHYANMRGYTTDKASVRLNSGDWVDINNSTVTCEEPEASARCVDGPMHTIRFRLSIDQLGALQDGANALTFRFNYAHPSGELGDPSTGYRILGLELRNSSGTDQVDGTTFEWDNPGSWTAPDGYGSASDVSAGESLWHERNLLIDGWNGEEIWASCADCHVKNGYDLEYFAFSNKSIVERSRFHGLSAEEGKQIAAYIRSLELTTEDGSTIDPPGRPWDPPYQPGPTAAGSRADGAPRTQGQSFSALDPIHWAAGAGVEWALDSDAEMKDFLFPNGVVYEGDAKVESSLNMRNLPTAAQMPDWNEWLPVHHPIDVWGEEFESSAVWNAYQNEVPDLIAQAKNGNVKKAGRAAHLFHHHLQASPEQFRNVPIPAPYEYEAAELSRMQWGAVKTFETLHTNHFENDAEEVYGPSAEPLQWLSNSRIIFDQAPHIQGWVKGEGSGIMDRYHDAAWYHLQLVINSGSGISTRNSPVDWGYLYSHTKAANDVGGPHAWRYVASYLRAVQNANGLDADYSDTSPEGWWMKRTSPAMMERQLGHLAKNVLPALSADEYRRVLNVSMQALMSGLEDTDFSEWARNGLDASQHDRQFGIEPESHDPLHIKDYGSSADPLDRWTYRYDDTTYADHFWTALEYFGEDGAAYSVLQQMATWAETAWPKGDWAGRIAPYEDNPPLDQPAAGVSFTAPSDGATFTEPTSIALEASASVPDANVETVRFSANGTALGSADEPPYTATWTDVPTGTHTLAAEVTGTDGTTATDELTVTVEAASSPPPEDPPTDDPDPTDAPLTWAYYEGAWSELPDFGSMSPLDEGTSEAFTLSPAQRDDNFGLRFTGTLDVPADGEYTFYTESDDGSRLSIGGEVVVNNDGVHAPEEASGTITLSAGPHPITVDYFEAEGGEQLTVQWASPQFSKEPIAADDLQGDSSAPGETTEYTVDLQTGWNLVALPVAPTNPSMEAVLGEAHDAVVVVKNEVGDVYSPQNGITSLTRWRAQEAYQVYVTEPRSMTVSGQRLAPDTPLDLAEGWNYVPYLPARSLPIETAFASLDDALLVVKDEVGNPYVSEGPLQINEIGQAQPGQGYRVYVDARRTLTYPAAPSASQSPPLAASTGPAPGGVANDATLIVETPSLDDGTIVSARVNDHVVADAPVTDGAVVLTVPGADPFAPEDTPHAAPGDRITLQAGREATRTSIEPEEITNLLGPNDPPSGLRFAPNAVYVVEGDATPDTFSLGKNYPNPAQGQTSISYTLPEPSAVRIEIYNLLGQRVETVVDATKPPGTYEATLDASSLGSGVYFYRLDAGSHRKTRKMTVVK